MLTRKWRRRFALVAAGLAFLVIGAMLGLRLNIPRLDLQTARTTVISTLQSEAPESILVTGSLQVAVTTVSQNSRYLLPGVVPLDLGTTSATVRVPGTVYYGLDVAALGAENISAHGNVLHISVPDVRVVSVEPDLAELELETRLGWARTSAGSGAQATREALAKITNALREQGVRHVEEALQPRINSANAILDVVTRSLEAAGLRVDAVRIEVEPGVFIERAAGVAEPGN